MSLSGTPMKLGENGKRAFLEHMYAIIYREFRFSPNSQVGAGRLFKSLAISKSFIDCSRLHSTYSLNLTLRDVADDQPDQLELYFSSEKKYSYFGVKFGLTFGKAKRLLRFLMPTFFGVHFYGENLNIVPFNRISELVSITNGKIGLFFPNVPNGVRFRPLVQMLARRLSELGCEAVVYEQIGSMNQVLDFCQATSLESIGQLKRVLRHDMKTLELSAYVNHYLRGIASDDEKNDIVRNSHVETIHLRTFGCQYDDNLEIITTLLDSCPKLKEFNIDSVFCQRLRHFEFGYIIDQALKYRDRMNELRDSYLGQISKKSISFSIVFRHNSEDEYDHGWVEQLKERFTGWNVHASYFYSLQDEGNEFAVAFALADPECPLKLEVQLNWPGQLNEELHLAYPWEDLDDSEERKDQQ